MTFQHLSISNNGVRDSGASKPVENKNYHSFKALLEDFQLQTFEEGKPAGLTHLLTYLNRGPGVQPTIDALKLRRAVADGNTPLVEQLLSSGMDVNAVDQQGNILSKALLASKFAPALVKSLALKHN